MGASKIYVSGIKRFADICVSILLLVFLFLFLCIIMCALVLHFKGSPTFVQERVGKGDKIFRLFKLRTMKTDYDETSTTRFGKFLRSTSIDELPQLFNVLKGEMSFIGPRPLLPEYLPYYNSEEKLRHTVKPGITGWAQVNGRNEIDWGERMKMDVFYVRNLSLPLDFKILLLTILTLVKGDKTPYKSQRTIPFSEYASKR